MSVATEIVPVTVYTFVSQLQAQGVPMKTIPLSPRPERRQNRRR